jgi:hypothetical protein
MENQSLTGRFGAEIELNAFDMRDFVKNPLAFHELPKGIEHVAEILLGLGLECKIHDWQYNHNPSCWSCKPDSSCGIELCSPVLNEGSKNQLFSVIDAISVDENIHMDERCSFHVHVELSSMDMTSTCASILAWWIKCEHVFVDFASPSRKNNFYCRPIGLMDLFKADEPVSSSSIFSKLSCKHLSANAFHLYHRRRPTLEFRIAEAVSDSKFAEMWIRIILKFCESASAKGMPSDYLWMRPEQVIDFLDLDIELKCWILNRLICNASLGNSECFSPKNREHALIEYRCCLEKHKYQ